MKKIGIITFHKAQNYGAVLQTYALQETVKSFGYDVVVLDHFNRKIHDQYKLSFWEALTNLSVCSKLKRLLGNLYRFYSLPIRIIARQQFIKFVNKN